MTALGVRTADCFAAGGALEGEQAGGHDYDWILESRNAISPNISRWESKPSGLRSEMNQAELPGPLGVIEELQGSQTDVRGLLMI